ncbi:hypothetical protein BH24ACT22_BH24ACT22_11690 [soil metagenome]
MVFDRKVFGAFAAMVGAVLLLTVLLATPALGQVEVGGQYDNDDALCQAVINIILNNNQGNQSDQYVNNISQELDISPSIVQECVEGEFGDDDPDNGENGDDDGDGELVVAGATIIDVPSKELPKTGGISPLIFALSILAGSGLLTSVLLRRC